MAIVSIVSHSSAVWKTKTEKFVVLWVSHAKTRPIICCTYSIASYCRTITISPAIKHHLNSPRMGQGYMPEVCLSGLHGIKVIPFPINICVLSEQVTSFAAKKTTTYSHSHQCKLYDSKCSDQLHLHAYWRL